MGGFSFAFPVSSCVCMFKESVCEGNGLNGKCGAKVSCWITMRKVEGAILGC